MTFDELFKRATDKHLMLGFFHQSAIMEPNKKWAFSDHFERIFNLLEMADKIPREPWTSIVRRGFGEIDTVDTPDADWRTRLDDVVASATRRRRLFDDNSPEWIAHGIIENLACLRLLLLTECDGPLGDGMLAKIYRLAEEWILDDVSPPDLIPRKHSLD